MKTFDWLAGVITIIAMALGFVVGKGSSSNTEPTPIQALSPAISDTVFVEVPIPFDTCACTEWKAETDSIREELSVVSSRVEWNRKLILQDQVARFKREHLGAR